MAMIDEFISGGEALEMLAGDAVSSIMVLGGPDSGKTSLVEALADFISMKGAAGIVDLDMGQSHIGPPTTVAWGIVDGGFRGWGDIKTEDFYFTGTLSPPGSLLPVLAGAGVITGLARKRCAKVIMDTGGLVDERIGRALKHHKIDILGPDLIIALQREDELEHILAPFRFNTLPKILDLRPPEAVTLKTVSARSGYRTDVFRSYFEGAKIIKFDMASTGLRFTRPYDNEGDLRGRIVSLRDRRNVDLSLGVLEDMDRERQRALIRTPLKKRDEVACMIIGYACLGPEVFF